MINCRTVTVVGGGIVGLAIARAFAIRGLSVTLLEKEPALGTHQTGRNSGVIHAGPYYKPGSLKAHLCVSGGQALRNYASERGLQFNVPGKLIVANSPISKQRVEEIAKRASKNRVAFELVSANQIREIEPYCVANSGIHIKTTGVIDYQQVAQSFARDLYELGGKIKLNSAVVSICNEGSKVRVCHNSGEDVSDYFVNAAGLESDRVARLAGLRPKIQIIPFKGQYFDLRKSKSNLVRGMIYPAPNPEMPFLGVHLTKSLNGSVHAGPNALLAMGRHSYSRWSVNPRDLSESLLFPGLWKFLWANRAFALKEGLRVASEKIFISEVSKLIEGVEFGDLFASKSGIRAQAMTDKGVLVDDFVLERHRNQVHILNAPSPAATASLAIADWIVNDALSG